MLLLQGNFLCLLVNDLRWLLGLVEMHRLDGLLFKYRVWLLMCDNLVSSLLITILGTNQWFLFLMVTDLGLYDLDRPRLVLLDLLLLSPDRLTKLVMSVLEA